MNSGTFPAHSLHAVLLNFITTGLYRSDFTVDIHLLDSYVLSMKNMVMMRKHLRRWRLIGYLVWFSDPLIKRL